MGTDKTDWSGDCVAFARARKPVLRQPHATKHVTSASTKAVGVEGTKAFRPGLQIAMGMSATALLPMSSASRV